MTTQITVKMPDERYDFFMELISYLPIEVVEHDDIPQAHKELLDQRLKDYENKPDQVLDFDEAMNDIEKDL